jgi:hypothetical protein
MEARSCNHFCSGKAASITYSDCISVALGIQNAMRMRRVLSSCVSCSAVQYFSTLSHKRNDFGKKKVTERKIYVLIFSTTLFWNIPHSKNWAIYDQQCILIFMQSASYSCNILMKLEFSQQIFEKYWNIKLHEKPSTEGRVVPCGRTDG